MVFGIDDAIAAGLKIIDKFIPDPAQKMKAEADLRESIMETNRGQMEVNKQEAAHKSVFVAGWRPGMGWVGVAAMGYQFLLHPLLLWGWTFMQAKDWIPKELPPPPAADAGPLFAVVTGMLGLGGMRSFDKMKKTVTDSIRG